LPPQNGQAAAKRSKAQMSPSGTGATFQNTRIEAHFT
jgi:hypothetical protein